MALDLTVNGVKHSVDVAPENAVLWVSATTLDDGDQIQLRHCQCGACTLHIDDQPSAPAAFGLGRGGQARDHLEGCRRRHTPCSSLEWSRTCRNAGYCHRA